MLQFFSLSLKNLRLNYVMLFLLITCLTLLRFHHHHHQFIGNFQVERISTKENGSELLIKPLSRERTEYLMRIIGTKFMEGRATSAKALVEYE